MTDPVPVTNPSWPRIAVVGAGGVGCYFGGMLARAGAPVVFIARPNHALAMQSRGLIIERPKAKDTVAVQASTDIAAARDAELVLLCAKTTNVVEAARQLVPLLPAHATVLCLQNGVDSADRVREASGLDALPVVVYVAAEMVADGHVQMGGRGVLITGDPDPAAARTHARPLAALASLFAAAGVPFTISANIRGDLWQKMVLNCTYNALSAIARVRYGAIHANPATAALVPGLIAECVAVATALGVAMPDVDLYEAGRKLTQELAAAAYSSTAQDLMRGRKTEIDSLNGYIAREGARHGIATPLNQTLHALVTLQEDAATTK